MDGAIHESGYGAPKGAWNINFVERFSKPFTQIENPGYKTRSHLSSLSNGIAFIILPTCFWQNDGGRMMKPIVGHWELKLGHYSHD